VRSTLTAHDAANVDLAGRIRGPVAALAALATAVALFVPARAQADPPTRVTVVAVFDPLTYGENGYVNGHLFGDGQGAQLVALEQSAPPFTEWTPVAQTTSDAAGYYSFKLHPSQTLQYRTSSQGIASDRVVQISVAPRVKLKARPAGRTSVRFSGTFAPLLDGQSVSIQRRDSNGSWTTIGTARLHNGRTFQGRVRAHRPVTLRAFFATDGAHLDAYSNTAKASPRAKAATARAAACRRPSITRIAWRPNPPVAGQSATLRVTAAMPAGRLYAIDALWGEGDKRDHFTLAPSLRRAKVTFTLRHRYARRGTYTLRVRVFGKSGTCKSSRTVRPRVQVRPQPEMLQP
jgi:hypothetical protein